MKTEIQKVRENLGLSQIELSRLLNIPVKSIRNWENDIRTPSDYIVELMTNTALTLINEKNLIDMNEKQVLSFVTIKKRVKSVVANYNIARVYLYGSYAKGTATSDSDIDLYMISDIDGIDYFGLIEELRTILNKNVDLLSNKTIKKNTLIEEEIKKTGVLIYERWKVCEENHFIRH